MTSRRIVISLIGFLACLGVGGCAKKESVQTQGQPTERIDQIVASVPQEEMRERWRSAHSNGQLPNLNKIPMPQEPISMRRRTMAAEGDLDKKISKPDMPEGVVADVRLWSVVPMDEYAGPFSILEKSADKWVGRIQKVAEPFEIHYRFPDKSALMAPPETAALHLTFREKVVNLSLHRLVHLRDQDGLPWLLFISEGSGQPYYRAFDQPTLSIRQENPSKDGVAPVTVTYETQQRTLRPGDLVTLDTRQGKIKIFLLSSYYTLTTQWPAIEGDPYHVALVLYRPQE